MLLITEAEFRNILLLGIKNDPLVDCQVYDLIHSFNDFDDPRKGLEFGCQIGSVDMVRVMTDEIMKSYEYESQQTLGVQKKSKQFDLFCYDFVGFFLCCLCHSNFNAFHINKNTGLFNN